MPGVHFPGTSGVPAGKQSHQSLSLQQRWHSTCILMHLGRSSGQRPLTTLHTSYMHAIKTGEFCSAQLGDKPSTLNSAAFTIIRCPGHQACTAISTDIGAVYVQHSFQGVQSGRGILDFWAKLTLRTAGSLQELPSRSLRAAGTRGPGRTEVVWEAGS